MLLKIKDLAIVFGIVASIIGAGVAYGKVSQQIDDTIRIVDTNKEDIGRDIVVLQEELIVKRSIDLEQTVLIQQVVVEVRNIAKITEKLEKKLDR